MTDLRAVAVFCGASTGADPAFAAAARAVGTALARRGLTLVFGGGHVGLMGVVADAALAAGGRAVGVIPRAMEAREEAHRGLTELHVVETMHARKAKMADLADAFLVLPGGIGTLEEMFEVWTWGQLGLHAKPLGMLDVNGFFAPLRAFVEQLVAQRFVREAHGRMLLVDDDAGRLLAAMSAYSAPRVEKRFDFREV